MRERVPSEPTTRARSSRELSRFIVYLFCALAAAGAAVAGCHPSGSTVADPIETAMFAAGFTLLVSRSSRGVWLAIGVVCVVLSRGLLLAPALVTVLCSFGAVFLRRSHRRAGAVIGALGVQVVLRWPSTLFHGFPSLAAAALVVLVGVSAWRRSSTRWRRGALLVLAAGVGIAVLVSVPALVEAAVARHDALSAENAAHRALDTIGSSNTSAVTAELEIAATDARRASSSMGQWFTLGARVVPIVAQQDRFLDETLAAAASAAAVGAAESPAIDYHHLGYHDGRISLPELAAMEHPMTLLRNALAVASRRLGAADSAWLLGPLADRAQSFRHDVTRALHGARLAVEGAKELPGILGGSGTRSYLVAFMTPSEARGYDGLVGSYGLLTATAGRVRLETSGSISDIQQQLPSGGGALSGLSEFLGRYGAFDPGRFPQDASYTPDLPTMAKVLEELYEQSGGGPVDGVLALDPIGLAALLHFTGPVQVAGLPFPLTQQNAANVLLKEQYTTFDTGISNQDAIRHDFLQSALHAAFDDLVSGSLPAPNELGAVLAPVASAGRISFWSFHPDEQPFLRQLGIDGSFPSAGGGDLLAVTTQNSGNNKIDAYLHTTVGDAITFDPSTGSTQSVVTVHLRNSASGSGLPPIVIDSPADPGLAPGVNRTWLTLYSPLALRSIRVDGHLASATSKPELGVMAYSIYVDVPPDGRVDVVASLGGRLRAGPQLRVAVRQQPSANPEAISIDVAPAGPWRVTTLSEGPSESWTLSQAMRQDRVFNFAPG